VLLLCRLLTGAAGAAGLFGLGYKTEPRQRSWLRGETEFCRRRRTRTPPLPPPALLFFLEYRADIGSKMCKGLAALPATCLKRYCLFPSVC